MIFSKTYYNKREKNIVSYKGTLIRVSADFSEETLGLERLGSYIQSAERKKKKTKKQKNKTPTKNILSGKVILEI